MQLMIDLQAETPAAMRLCAQFLIDQANLRERTEGAAPAAVVPAPVAPVAPLAGDFNPADLARAQQDMNTSGPLAPPAPAAMVPVVPVVPVASVPSVSAPVAPPAPAAPIASTPVAQPDEFDTSGVPFDGRIHQKTKGVKKDGTWKLQKNINEALVTQVMQELAARIRPAGVPAGTAAPTAPAVPTAHYINGVLQTPISVPAGGMVVPAPPAPPTFGQAPLPAGVEPASVLPHVDGPGVHNGVAAPAAPPAPAPVAPVAPAAPSAPALDPFRALVRKITDAKAAQRITVEEVAQCVANAGAPSLQLLNNMPHLIGAVEANIDVVLALR